MMAPAPTPPAKKRKAPTLLTDDMRRKVATEYAAAGKLDKAAIRARYNVSTGAICDWIAKGYANGKKPAAPFGKARKVDRSLEDLLWTVVIAARERGDIDVSEARRLLELAR
jgi:transposase